MTGTEHLGLYAVGQLLGVQVPETGALGGWEVRLGDEIRALPSADLAAVWLLCRGVLGDDEVHRSREAVLAAADEQGVDDADDHLAALTAAGLVVVAEDARALEELAAGHRVEVQMTCLGNVPETPELYALGIEPDEVLAVATEDVLQVWLYAHLSETIADAVTEQSEVDPDSPVRAGALATMMQGVSQLLARECLYLDRPSRTPEEDP